MNKYKALGNLESGKEFPTMAFKFFFSHTASCFYRNNGFDSLIPPGIGHTDNCCFLDGRMFKNHILNLSWGHVEPPGLYDIIFSPFKIKVTIFVKCTHIMSIIPSIFKSLSGQLRLIPIAWRNTISFNNDLPYTPAGTSWP